MIKEAAYYKKEVQENERQLQQMKDDGKDPHDIKKFQEVLDESLMMVPDSEQRLSRALQDLRDFVVSAEVVDTKGEWYTKAQEILREHNVSGNDCEIAETKVDDLAEGEAF